MRRTWLAILLGASIVIPRQIVAASAIEQLEQEQQALFEKVALSVVFIATRDGFGSGFFVDCDGLILTSAHVVGDRRTVEVITHDGQRSPGQVVELGRDGFDLALVKVRLKSSPLQLAGDAIRVGTWVGSVGHGLGGAWAFTTGMLTNVYPLGHERPVFQTQVPVNPGSSGGPIFDRLGRVIGVVTAAVTNASDVNFAVRAAKACDVLAGAAKLCRRLVLRGPQGLPLFLDKKSVGTGPQVTVSVSAGPHEAFVVEKGQMRRQRFQYPQQDEVDLSH
jgi:S1-C subfamily serine protease